jgi:two-component system, OmpR family, sensor histidine kinase ChvG
MVPVTDSPKTEPADLALGWSRGLSLSARILAVNLFVLVLLGAGLFFLDSYRTRLIEDREAAARMQTEFLANSLPLVGAEGRSAFIAAYAQQHQSRVRIYAKDGTKLIDSFAMSAPTYDLRSGADEPWRKVAARGIDRVFDFLVMAPDLDAFREPKSDTATAWLEIRHAKPGQPVSFARFAPDLTHVISAAA